jgi:nucleoside-diphosphate-sugar epimerase
MTDGAEDRPLVLITGASGRIGTRAAKHLVPDDRVAGLDVKPPPGDFPAQAPYVRCDLTTDAGTLEALEALKAARDTFGSELASVIHLAAYYDFSGAPSPLYEELTVGGTRRLSSALRSGFTMRQLVFSSTRLGWTPRHRLADVLPHMIDALERDPATWYAENHLPDSFGGGVTS